MTLEEALAIIGIAPAPAPTLDELRRAYLRKVRVTRPEVDPDGFRRLREAYELAQVRLEAAQATPQEAWDLPQEPPSAAATASSQGTTTADPPEPAADVDPVQAWIEAVREAAPERRWLLAQALLAEQPEREDVRWLALQAMGDPSSDAAVTIAMDGLRLGHERFLDHLLAWAPNRIPSAWLARAAYEGPLPRRLHIAVAMADGGDPHGAHETLVKVLSDREAVLADSQILAGGLDVIFALHETNVPRLALDAQVHLRTAIGAGPDVNKTPQSVVIAWLLTEELWRLGLVLPASYRLLIAHCARTGDWSTAAAQAATLASTEGDGWVRHILSHAPTIASNLGYSFGKLAQKERGAAAYWFGWFQRFGRYGFGVIFLLVNIIRCVNANTDVSPAASPSVVRASSDHPIPTSDRSQLYFLQATVDSTCAGKAPVRGCAPLQEGLRMFEARGKHDCSTIRLLISSSSVLDFSDHDSRVDQLHDLAQKSAALVALRCTDP